MDKVKLQIGGPDRASLGEVTPGLNRSASQRTNLARARTADVAMATPATAANRRNSVWLPRWSIYGCCLMTDSELYCRTGATLTKKEKKML